MGGRFKREGIYVSLWLTGASQVRLAVKSLLAKAGDIRDVGFIPGLGRSPGGGHGNLLQCSSLENPMDRGARWATVHGVTKLDATKQLHFFFFVLKISMLC